ncbi:hypothetical protein PBI_BLUE_2 [Mycobacterium phage Blue]|nr:hypothetical protein PBI_BLUE_2 [Mycobacterium phage Blue]
MYRYASSMGERYAMPVYFEDALAAVAHRNRADRILTGLPGHDSMRLEALIDGVWEPLE